ncbi:MAG: cupin-like domain-containing protein [Novosphingobium sp.]
MAETPPHLAALPRVAERALGPGGLDAALAGAREPFVVRGLAADWPLVRASLVSGGAARAYLAERARARSFPASIGQPGGDARLFYDAAMQMNFHMAQGSFAEWMDAIAATEADPAAPTVYLSSIDIDAFFDGLGEENTLPLGKRRPIASIWIGSRTRIAAHNDVPDNLAVCAAGKRRFTLFPPEQFANLYPGPLEHNPGGRPVSMVDLHEPDLAAYPRFAAALANAQMAELEPGNAVFVPSLWWHHVEGLAPFNLLVNYWWRDVPAFLGQPEDALYHAVLSIRDLPEADRQRWRDLFEHYVFSGGEDAAAHLPEAARGVLAPLTPDTAGRLKAKLLRGLSR